MAMIGNFVLNKGCLPSWCSLDIALNIYSTKLCLLTQHPNLNAGKAQQLQLVQQQLTKQFLLDNLCVGVWQWKRKRVSVSDIRSEWRRREEEVPVLNCTAGTSLGGGKAIQKKRMRRRRKNKKNKIKSALFYLWVSCEGKERNVRARLQQPNYLMLQCFNC